MNTQEIDQLNVSDDCKSHLKQHGWAFYESNKPQEYLFRVCWVHDDNMERFDYLWDVEDKFKPDGRDSVWATNEVEAIVKVANKRFVQYGISAENLTYWRYA